MMPNGDWDVESRLREHARRDVIVEDDDVRGKAGRCRS
jgi:hypothetical protein